MSAEKLSNIFANTKPGKIIQNENGSVIIAAHEGSLKINKVKIEGHKKGPASESLKVDDQLG